VRFGATSSSTVDSWRLSVGHLLTANCQNVRSQVLSAERSPGGVFTQHSLLGYCRPHTPQAVNVSQARARMTAMCIKPYTLVG